MKKFLSTAIIFITIFLCFTISTNAAQLGSPQNMDGLQIANISYYLGDSNTINDAIITQDLSVTTTAYTSGLNIAKLVTSQNIGTNTKIRLKFSWSPTAEMNINVLCLSNVPSDFKITISADGTSSMTGSNYSQSLNYVDQQNGWYRYDTFSSSATQTPVFSNVYSLYITIDGGSAQLSTLGDDNIVLSLSMLPYNLMASADLQYQRGYSDAQQVYKSSLQQEKENSYNSGLQDGYNNAIGEARDTLIPEAYQEGKRDGFTEGKQAGLEIANNSDLRELIFAIPDAHLTSLSGFINWELLGFNLYELLGGVFMLLIIGIILRFCFKAFL